MLDSDDRRRMIEKINLLGPWTHGYFDLGNGIIIEDKDDIQKSRLLKYREYFEDIIREHYQTNKLNNKTLCEIGCNTGYFIYEMLKRFDFIKVTGLEPKKSNLDKAKFIAEIFDLPDTKFELKAHNILDTNQPIKQYDVVLMPGVLHHLDNHLNALNNLYRMTGDLCIIETIVLPDSVNSEQKKKFLELKDDFYRSNKNYFGLVGYKFESGDFDGSAVQDGIVAVPTEKALKMMLEHVGFDDIEVYKSTEDLEREIYRPNLYRHVAVVILKCTKKKKPKNQIREKVELENKEIYLCLPYGILSEIYKFITGHKQINDLSDVAKLIIVSQKDYSTKNGIAAWTTLSNDYSFSDDQLNIIATFKHAFDHKVFFEYAKACFQKGREKECIRILEDLIGTCNLDWRTVYRSYYLMGVIYFERREYKKSSNYIEKSLIAYPNFMIAAQLNKKLRDKWNL